MRILIVEDEPLIARRLQQFCRAILGDDVESLRVAGDFSVASLELATSPIDLVLLDLNLAGADGMDLLGNSAAGSFHTIVVSAYVDEALRAFEYGVLDFIPKPFTQERVAKALRRATASGGRSDHPARRLAIRKHGRIEIVPVDDILYLQGADKYTELVLRGGRRELHDKLLSRLEVLLPATFVRIHKSYIVRLDAVVRLHALEGSQYEAELSNGLRLPIGRSRYREIKARFA